MQLPEAEFANFTQHETFPPAWQILSKFPKSDLISEMIPNHIPRALANVNCPVNSPFSRYENAHPRVLTDCPENQGKSPGDLLSRAFLLGEVNNDAEKLRHDRAFAGKGDWQSCYFCRRSRSCRTRCCWTSSVTWRIARFAEWLASANAGGKSRTTRASGSTCRSDRK